MIDRAASFFYLFYLCHPVAYSAGLFCDFVQVAVRFGFTAHPMNGAQRRDAGGSDEVIQYFREGPHILNPVRARLAPTVQAISAGKCISQFPNGWGFLGLPPRMPAKIRFDSAAATRLILAKVGRPQHDEPLQTSKHIYEVPESDRELLTSIFLKPFKNLSGHRFHHHSSLEKHEMNALSAAIFDGGGDLLEKGCEIAKRLYSKSNHPNIKSGDLCIAVIDDVEIDGEAVQAICILKSESVTPFLSISTRDGDLELHTEQGINPEKIDKGCLILNSNPHKGYHVLTFDRSGAESRFWVRDFLGVVPVTDASFLTHKYADMAVAVVEKARREQQEQREAEASSDDDTPPWDTCSQKGEALAFFEGRESFSLPEFEEQVLKTPEAVATFRKHRAEVEAEHGHAFDESFEISKKDLNKAKKKIGTVMKLDTGVELHFKHSFAAQTESILERGFDTTKGMKFVKVFYNDDVSSK